MSRSTTHSSTGADCVSVLTYHAVVATAPELEAWPPGARLYVFALDELCRQLDHLATEGFETITMAHFAQWHRGEAELPERPVVVSFDDGHRSNAELAVPALSERGQRAIFFVTAGRVGRDDVVTWEHLRAMLDAGMEVGSHTLTHRAPSSLTLAELEHELAESKRVLEEGTGASVDFVASPTGYDNRHFARLARQVGYHAALQGVIGRNRRSTDPFALRRFVLKRSHSFETFCCLVDPRSKVHIPMRIKQAARNAIRRLVGVRAYEAIRCRLLGSGNGKAEG